MLTHKQVEHDVSDDDIKGAEVDEGAGVIAAVRLPVTMFVWGAERRLHLGITADKQTNTTHGAKDTLLNNSQLHSYTHYTASDVFFTQMLFAIPLDRFV